MSSFRTKHGLFVCKESLNSSLYSKDILLKQQRINQLSKESLISQTFLSDSQMKQFSGQREHEGFILKASQKEYIHVKKQDMFFKTLSNHQSNLFVVLDQITDPQNFGTIIRTCYLLGADCVLVNKSNKPPLSPALAKVSSGVSELIPIFSLKFIKLFLEEAIKENYKVLTTYVDSRIKTVSLNNLKLNKGENVIIVFGSEGQGISDVLKKSSSLNIKIKGLGESEFIDSLNVGVSTGILINKVSSMIK